MLNLANKARETQSTSSKFAARDAMREISRNWPVLVDRPFQAVMTFITGIAYEGEEPLITVSPLTYVFGTFFFLTVGVLGSNWVINQPNRWCWLLYPVFFTMTQSAAWSASVLVAHHGVHAALSGNPKTDRWIAEVASTIVISLPFDQYYLVHVPQHHNWSKLATIEDPDMVTLIRLGFEPGYPVTFYWVLLFTTILSPLFHIQFFKKRLRANLVKAPLYRRLMSAIWLGGLLTVTALTDSWMTLFWGWLLPLTLGFNTLLLLEFLSEHLYGVIQLPGESISEWHERKTFNRLLGEMPPLGKGFSLG